MNASEAVPPCTPLKPTGNGGAGRVDQEGKMNYDSENSDKSQSAMTKRKWNGRESWTMIKHWVTGEQAEMDQDDILVLIGDSIGTYSNLHVNGWKCPS
jgi:hypothetical protein